MSGPRTRPTRLGTRGPQAGTDLYKTSPREKFAASPSRLLLPPKPRLLPHLGRGTYSKERAKNYTRSAASVMHVGRPNAVCAPKDILSWCWIGQIGPPAPQRARRDRPQTPHPNKAWWSPWRLHGEHGCCVVLPPPLLRTCRLQKSRATRRPDDHGRCRAPASCWRRRQLA